MSAVISEGSVSVTALDLPITALIRCRAANRAGLHAANRAGLGCTQRAGLGCEPNGPASPRCRAEPNGPD